MHVNNLREGKRERENKRDQIKRAGPEMDHPRNLPTSIGRSAELDHKWHQVFLNGNESSCMWDRSRL